MGWIDQVEKAAENFAARIFKRSSGPLKPIEVITSVKREIDNNAYSLSRTHTVCPNVFDIYLSPADYETFVSWNLATLGREITAAATNYIHEQTYSLEGSVQIGFREDGKLSTGTHRIESRTERTPVGPALNTGENRYPVVVVNGKRIQLFGETITVGRSRDADIHIQDDTVSALHAQLEVTPRGTILRDLNSTNGTRVENKKIQAVTLTDGNTIRMGRAVILFEDAGMGGEYE